MSPTPGLGVVSKTKKTKLVRLATDDLVLGKVAKVKARILARIHRVQAPLKRLLILVSTARPIQALA